MKKETEKERQKRLKLTRVEEATKGSKFYKIYKCKGTIVNAGFDKNKKQIQKLINYRVNKAPRNISSTKLGNQSGVKFLRQTERRGRYQPQMLTVLTIMRMTKKQRKNIETPISRHYAFRAK